MDGQLLNTKNYSKALILFFLSFSIYLFSHYLMQKAIFSTLIFYLTTVPSFFYFVYEEKFDFAKLISKNKLLIFLFVYISIHTICMFNEMEPRLAFKGVRDILATFIFIIIALCFFSVVDEKLKHLLIQVYAFIGVLCTLVSIGLYVYSGNYEFGSRIIPLGFARHEILGASLYATPGILCLYLAFFSDSLRARIPFFFMSLLIMALIVLTFSRGPILAYLICYIGGIVLFSHDYKRLFFYFLIIFIAIILVILMIPELMEYLYVIKVQLLERGSSYRLDLWKLTLERISEQPFLGYGVRNVFESNVPGGYSPHNIYLSTAYYFGIPVLIILIGILCQATYIALSNYYNSSYNKLLVVLLAHAMLSVVTDHGQFVRGNTPVWIIFWMPICMCLGSAHSKLVNRSVMHDKKAF